MPDMPNMAGHRCQVQLDPSDESRKGQFAKVVANDDYAAVVQFDDEVQKQYPLDQLNVIGVPVK